MDIIPLRSPRYEIETAASSGELSATLELSIDGTLRYSITKNCTANQTVVFEISELARDYLQTPQTWVLGGLVYIFGTQVEISRSIKFYSAANGGGSLVRTVTQTYNGFDGYGEWTDGANFEIPKGATNAFLLSKLEGSYEVFVPPSTNIKINATDTNDDIANLTNVNSGSSDSTYSFRSSTLNIRVVDCNRFTPTAVYFVNKFGGIQPLFFFTKKVDVLNTKSETFQRNIIDTSTTTPSYFRPAVSTYPSYPHSIKTYNKNGKKSYILSSGYYPERANTYFEQLLLSEAVWIDINNTPIPVTVKTSSITFKTSLNDRLIEYTIEFEEAQDFINNVR